jgi:hypothetical protein
VSAEDGTPVKWWCPVCRRYVDHHASVVAVTRAGRVLHVTPAVLAKHRATHAGGDAA